MKVHEIAKATGRSNQQIAEDFGLEGEALHLRSIDDEAAETYVKKFAEAVPEDAKMPVVRFWSKSRDYYIPSGGSDKRDDIRWRRWLFEGGPGSAEVVFLRKHRDYLIAQDTYEVIEKPFEDPATVADFMQFLRAIIFTGSSDSEGPSREGRDCVKALLTEKAYASMDTQKRNDPRTLIRAVANAVSLNLDAFGGEM